MRGESPTDAGEKFPGGARSFVDYLNVQSEGSRWATLLNVSREIRLREKSNSVDEQLRSRQLSSRAVRGGAPRICCTVRPMTPPEVTASTRRLGPAAVIRESARVTRSRKAVQGSTGCPSRPPSSQSPVRYSNMRW